MTAATQTVATSALAERATSWMLIESIAWISMNVCLRHVGTSASTSMEDIGVSVKLDMNWTMMRYLAVVMHAHAVDVIVIIIIF